MLVVLHPKDSRKRETHVRSTPSSLEPFPLIIFPWLFPCDSIDDQNTVGRQICWQNTMKMKTKTIHESHECHTCAISKWPICTSATRSTDKTNRKCVEVCDSKRLKSHRNVLSLLLDSQPQNIHHKISWRSRSSAAILSAVGSSNAHLSVRINEN